MELTKNPLKTQKESHYEFYFGIQNDITRNSNRIPY